MSQRSGNEQIKWRHIIAKNFVGGLMWGLGSVLGATIVVSVLAGTLKKLDFIPIIADWIVQIQSRVENRE